MNKILPVLCIFLISTAPSYSATLQEAMQKALLDNPDIKIAISQVEAQKAKVGSAFGSFLPSIDAVGSMSHSETDARSLGTSSSNPKSIGVSLTQDIFAGGANIYTHSAEKKRLLQAKSDYDLTTQNLLLEVVNAYLNVITNKEVLSLQEKQVELLSKQLSQAKTMLETGSATQTDVKQAQARLALSEANKASAISSVESSIADYQRVVGELPEDLSWPEVPDTSYIDFPKKIDNEYFYPLVNKHPSVISALFSLQASKRDLKTEKAGFLPTISASASYTESKGYTSAGRDQSDGVVKLSMTIPLFKGGKTINGVKEASESKAQAGEKLDNARRNVMGEIVSAYYANNAAVLAFKSLEMASQASSLATQGVLEEVKSGNRSILEGLDAQQELLQANVDLTKGRAHLIATSYRLLASVGELLEVK